MRNYRKVSETPLVKGVKTIKEMSNNEEDFNNGCQ